MTRSQFDDTNIFLGYTHWPRWPVQPECWKPSTWNPVEDAQSEYISELKAVATAFGVWPEEVDQLLADGVTPEEIEELLNGA